MTRRPRGLLLFLPALLLSAHATANVTQPTGEIMPQPTPMAEINVLTSRGFPADADTLAGLFTYHQINGVAGGDMAIDPIADAHTTPETFSPQCGLSGTIVDHGGVCQNALGWYNATIPATMPSKIYTLVPATLQMPYPNGISCADNDFCPVGTRMTNQAPQHSWANPLPDFAANIRTDPNWKGGPVGFALIGVPGTTCSETKYTQSALNDKSPSGVPWVGSLIYQSIADPNSYYICFEDQPTCAASWRGCDGNQPKVAPNGSDGDFNDFVFFVSGLSCSDGGQPCTVPNQMGICAGGVTQCAAGGTTTTCKQTVMPQPEVCDGVDNDCNGMVDDNVTCPNPGFVCSQGVCVHPCSDSEFPCIAGYTCDTDGLCKETKCVGKVCGMDQICKAGVCVGGCDGVTCPHGQVCRIGNCVDPCAGVTCDTGTVCENGACQPPCGDCRNCASGTMCTTSGANKGVCVETGCQNVTCPAGHVCIAGSCQDGCTNVVCPGGQACMNGSCSPIPVPDAGTLPPPTDAGTSGVAGSTGTGRGGTSGTAGTMGAAGAGATGTGGTMGGPHIGGVTTCHCDVAEGPGAAGVALMLGVLAIAARRGRPAPGRARRR
jgi:hypothetical protein